MFSLKLRVISVSDKPVLPAVGKDSVVSCSAAYVVGRSFYIVSGISHGNSDAGGLQHLNIIGAVACPLSSP